MDTKLTPTLRRQDDEWQVLLLIAEILDDASQGYAADGNSVDRSTLFVAGLYADAVERLHARVCRRLHLDNIIGEVTRLPSALKDGRRLIEEHDEREAVRKAVREGDAS
jgi:hypothetical protein